MQPSQLIRCPLVFILAAIAPILAAASQAEDPELAPLPGARTILSGEPWTPPPAGEDKVIYGDDDRIDMYQVTDPLILCQAASTCALVETSDLIQNSNGTYTLRTYAYRVGGLPPCAGEAFATQPTVSFCTGFLVDDDLIATAGHCYDTPDLSFVRFVFGFEMLNASTPRTTLNADEVYRGVEVVKNELSGLGDFAIIRVDRPVTAPGAVPLRIRRTDSVPVATPIGVIGHPWGLPKKVAFGANTTVRTNNAGPYFYANLDTYGGNSGSPVFNQLTGVVEGILVTGATDFLGQGSCFVSNRLLDSQGQEGCTKSTVWAQYVPEEDPDRPAVQVTPDQLLVGPDEGFIALTVQNPNAGTLEWDAEVTAGSDWITLLTPKVMGDGVLGVVYGTNPGSTARQGVIRIINQSVCAPTFVPVTQEGQPALSVTPSSLTVPSSAGQTSLQVQNAGGGVLEWAAQVLQGEPWLSITTAKIVGNGSITVFYARNTGDARPGIIEVTAPGAGGSPAEIVVTQAAATPAFLQVRPAFFTVTAAGGEFDIAVTNLGGRPMEWTASVTQGAAFIALQFSKPTDNGIIKATVAPNTSGANRSGVIRVEAPGTAGSPVNVTLSQAAETSAALAVSETTLAVGVAAGESLIEISNAGQGTMNWLASVVSGEDFLAVAEAKGTNSGSVTVSYAANLAPASRNGVVRITAEGAAGSPADITVDQRGADVDGDLLVTSTDVQFVINAALEILIGFNADLSGDGIVNSVDVQLVILAALQ